MSNVNKLTKDIVLQLFHNMQSFVAGDEHNLNNGMRSPLVTLLRIVIYIVPVLINLQASVVDSGLSTLNPRMRSLMIQCTPFL